mgnify:CR=1 FL=1
MDELDDVDDSSHYIYTQILIMPIVLEVNDVMWYSYIKKTTSGKKHLDRLGKIANYTECTISSSSLP